VRRDSFHGLFFALVLPAMVVIHKAKWTTYKNHPILVDFMEKFTGINGNKISIGLLLARRVPLTCYMGVGLCFCTGS
jgi:hypothetical protein